MPVFQRGEATAAALGVTGLQVGLPDVQLVPTLTAAVPQVSTVPLSGIGEHRQIAKLLANPVFQRRPAETAAAFPVAAQQLIAGRVDGIAAVALAVPDDGAAFAAPVRLLHRKELSKALAAQVTSGPYRRTAAVGDCPPLQPAGLHQNFPSAVAAAAPNRITSLALVRRRHSHQHTISFSGKSFVMVVSPPGQSAFVQWIVQRRSPPSVPPWKLKLRVLLQQ